MLTDRWEWAVIDQREARTAYIKWSPGRRLPAELAAIATQLGYSAAEMANYSVGELLEDMAVGDDTYLRGALVLPDENGLPAALFGKPLLGPKKGHSGLI